MDQVRLSILKDALSIQMRKETFEHALGRAVRNQKLDFKAYVEIVTEVRDVAYREKMALEDAARSLLEQKESGDEKAD